MSAKQFLFLAVATLAALPARAADYYVRQGASGSNTGADWTHAYPSVPATLVRGATYYVADGDYPRLVVGAPEDGLSRLVIKKATTAAHGTDAGWDDSMGDGYAYFPGATLENSYITVDGVTGEGTTGHGFWFHGSSVNIIYIREPSFSYQRLYGIEIRHAKLTTAENVETIHGIRPGQTILVAPRFEYLYFKDIWGNPFQIPTTEEDALIQYNVIDTMHKYGSQHLEAIQSQGGTSQDQSKVRNWTIRYNVWKDIKGTAGLVLVGPEHKVYGNIFMWSQDWGTTINNGIIGVSNSASGWSSDMEIYNNVFIDIRVNFFSGGSHTGHKIKNNVFVNTWTVGGDPNSKGVGWGGAEHSHNFFLSAGVHSEAGTEQQATSHPFASYAAFGGLNNALRLSRATDPGLTLAAPFNLAPDGIVRGADGVWDRGAFEFAEDGGVAPAAPSNLRIGP